MVALSRGTAFGKGSRRKRGTNTSWMKRKGGMCGRTVRRGTSLTCVCGESERGVEVLVKVGELLPAVGHDE